MNIKRYILILLTLCNAFIAFGQDNLPANYETKVMDTNVSPTNSVKAKFLIDDIKGRGIIVRLKTNKDRIAAYRKEGYNKVANQMEEKAKITNMLLTYAFITKWTYGPLYFMESQYTNQLMQHDTLIAKTADLLRDTAIYINRDSFYIVDYGEMMANEPLHLNTTYKDIDKTQQSNQSVGGSYIIVKDHSNQQLQAPLPFFAKVFFDDMSSTSNITLMHISPDLSDTVAAYVKRYRTTADIMKSDDKTTLNLYLSMVYSHIVNTGDGNRYEKAVERFNKHFIEYYCKRLDNDQGITCNSDPYYWWQRNPNIRYIPALLRIEQELKSSMDKDPKFTRTY